MKKILITRKLIKESEDKASQTFDPIFNTNDELYSQSKVIEMSQGCNGILTSLTDKMDKETINKLPDTIKIISNFAVGFGNIDLDAAKQKGIAVTNTPEVLSDATAEIGILLILGACRRASEGIVSAQEGGWNWSANYLIGKQLTGARLGILEYQVLLQLIVYQSNNLLTSSIHLLAPKLFPPMPFYTRLRLKVFQFLRLHQIKLLEYL